EYGQTDKIEVKDQEQKLAQQLIQSLAAPFDPDKYRDEYQESLRSMIAAKLKGQELTTVQHPQLAPVIDLMDALKKSLAEKQAGSPRKPPVRAVSAVAEMPAPKKAGRKSAG
ncbi:MAG TPA: Ku protein, partial [Candidatus Limnocylindria bacterium]|nr:Ku protein [Candidatus Limnocylindria bacterium]